MRNWFCYGCFWRDTPGHRLYRSNPCFKETSKRKAGPWALTDLDRAPGPTCLWCPDGNQEEGRGRLYHREGWTLLAFPDRTCDSRMNSFSAFIVDQTLTSDEMVTLASEEFDSIWSRFKFSVRVIK